MRARRTTQISRRAKSKPVHTARRASMTGAVSRAGGRRRLTRWAGATLAGLVAVLLIFGDALLTVEVQKVSMETNRLKKKLETLELELGTLDSEWASRSSRLALEERALELGLTVPEPDQVVLLPSSFLEYGGAGRAPNSAELRRTFVNNWMLLNPVGIP